MNDTCETVRVVSAEHEDGYKVINKSDFRDGVHQLHQEPPVEEQKPKRNRKQ